MDDDITVEAYFEFKNKLKRKVFLSIFGVLALIGAFLLGFYSSIHITFGWTLIFLLVYLVIGSMTGRGDSFFVTLVVGGVVLLALGSSRVYFLDMDKYSMEIFGFGIYILVTALVYIWWHLRLAKEALCNFFAKKVKVEYKVIRIKEIDTSEKRSRYFFIFEEESENDEYQFVVGKYFFEKVEEGEAIHVYKGSCTDTILKFEKVNMK
ncbi:MAG: hypothetical protein GY810_05415 [Aureispira sp.]|nr:hypothetical protein [Aureispira sp.]